MASMNSMIKLPFFLQGENTTEIKFLNLFAVLFVVLFTLCLHDNNCFVPVESLLGKSSLTGRKYFPKFHTCT